MDNPRLLSLAGFRSDHHSGQKPIMTKARKSIANFKLANGRLIGTKVTLRGDECGPFWIVC